MQDKWRITDLVDMISHKHSRVRAQESGDLGILISRNEDSQLLICQSIFVECDVREKVLPMSDVATVLKTRKRAGGSKAASVVVCVGKAKVVVGWGALGNCQ